MKQNSVNDFDQNPAKKRKILALDPSYKWNKYWKFIDIYFYCAICISFVLFLTLVIIFSLKKDLDSIKILGMVFGFLLLGLLAIAWMLIIFFKGPIKFINYSQKQLEYLYKKQKMIMVAYRIIFFSLTIIPIFMLIFASNIISLYYVSCLITIYVSFVLFIMFAIGTIILHIIYLNNKKSMHECVISDNI